MFLPLNGFSMRHRLSTIRCFVAFVLMCSCVFLAGCSTVKKVQHMSQLLTLKRYSESQDKISKEVEAQKKKFDELQAAVESGQFTCQNAREVRRQFGDPVFKRKIEHQGKTAQQWLYRYAKDFDGSKIYMYFDDRGTLINLERELAREHE